MEIFGDFEESCHIHFQGKRLMMGAETISEMSVSTRQRDVTFQPSVCCINITLRTLCLFFFILIRMTILYKYIRDTFAVAVTWKNSLVRYNALLTELFGLWRLN